MRWIQVLILVAFSRIAIAQELYCSWLYSLDNEHNLYSSDAECDNSGNWIISGAFGGQIKLDPYDSAFYLENSGMRKVFLAKYSPTQELIWATYFGGTSDAYIKQIRILNDNSILICGKYFGECDFLPGPEEYIIQPYGYSDAFFAHYSADGELLWAIGLGGPEGQDQGTSCNIDDGGNIYIGGYFNIYADIDPGPEEFLVYNPLGASWDMFIAKLNPSGEFLWGGSVNGSGIEVPTDFAFDEDENLVVSGLYEFQPDFDLSEGELILDVIPNGTYENAFIAKYSPEGNLISVKAWGNDGYDSVTWMSKNDNGYLIAGIYGSGNDLDPTDAVMQWPFHNLQDMYVAQLDNDLNFSWTYTAGGNDDDIIFDVDTDNYGNIILVGQFGGEIDFDPGPNEFVLYETLSNAADPRTMVVTLDEAGNFQEAQQVLGGWDNYATGVGINDNQIMVIGKFKNWISTGICEYTSITSDSPNTDVFMVEYTSTFLGSDEGSSIENEISIFPNPANESFTISLGSKYAHKKAELVIQSSDGRMVYQKEFTNEVSAFTIPVAILDAGMYFVSINIEDVSSVQRMVVAH
jgi:hypothetical protein